MCTARFSDPEGSDQPSLDADPPVGRMGGGSAQPLEADPHPPDADPPEVNQS